MKPRCSVWMPRLPPLWAKLRLGDRPASPRRGRARTVASQAGFRLAGSGAMPAAATSTSFVVGEEQLAGVGPEVVERGLHPAVALVAAVAEADDEVGGAFEVVGDLLGGLGGDLGDAGVGGGGQRLQELVVQGVEQELAHQRLAEVAVRALDEEDVAEVPGVAQVGEVVGAAALALDLGGEAEPELGLADQVERDVGERDVLLERRGVAAPFRDAVAEDQGVVAGAEQELEEGGLAGVGGRGLAWRAWAAASRASSATFGVVMSGSDGITCAPLRRGCRRRSGGGRPWRWPARRAAPCRTGSRR